MKCADVAKEFVNHMASVGFMSHDFARWDNKFKACEDFPREPEVVEFEANAVYLPSMTNPIGGPPPAELEYGQLMFPVSGAKVKRLSRRRCRVVCTEIIE